MTELTTEEREIKDQVVRAINIATIAADESQLPRVFAVGVHEIAITLLAAKIYEKMS